MRFSVNFEAGWGFAARLIKKSMHERRYSLFDACSVLAPVEAATLLPSIYKGPFIRPLKYQQKIVAGSIVHERFRRGRFRSDTSPITATATRMSPKYEYRVSSSATW